MGKFCFKVYTYTPSIVNIYLQIVNINIYNYL